jgi:hypothetical protein
MRLISSGQATRRMKLRRIITGRETLLDVSSSSPQFTCHPLTWECVDTHGDTSMAKNRASSYLV